MSELMDKIREVVTAHEIADDFAKEQSDNAVATARSARDRLAQELATSQAEVRSVTLQRDAVAEEYAKHLKDVHPTELPQAYSTKFGLGGGNGTRTDVEIDRRYYGPNDLNKMLADTTRNEGKNILSWNSMKFPYSWADMAKGRGDEWAAGVFRIMNEAVKPLMDDPDAVDEWWFSGHHEPEGDGDEDDWRITQDRLANLVPGGLDGPLKFWLTTTGWNQEFNKQRVELEVDWETNLFPHGAPIYGIAYDAPYNTYGLEWVNGEVTTNFNKSWTDPHVYIDALAKRGVQFDVEVAVGEWGYSHEAFEKDRTWAAQVMDRAINNPHKRLRAMCYFDTTLNSKKSWTLGASTSPKRTYVKEQMAARKGVK